MWKQPWLTRQECERFSLVISIGTIVAVMEMAVVVISKRINGTRLRLSILIQAIVPSSDMGYSWNKDGFVIVCESSLRPISQFIAGGG